MPGVVDATNVEVSSRGFFGFSGSVLIQGKKEFLKACKPGEPGCRKWMGSLMRA